MRTKWMVFAGGFLRRVAGCGLGVLLSAIAAAPAAAQTWALVTSTSGDAATADLPDIDDEEILVVTPGSGRAIATFLSDLTWEVVLGDANRNGRFDDEPAEVDAIAFLPGAPARPTIYDAYVSFGSSRTFVSGQVALDGDIVRLRTDGAIEIFLSESFLAEATGTSTIDVDALAIDPANGAVYFSFAENETTTLDSLIEQNGGPTLDDGCVFRLDPGAPRAHLVHREADFVAMVSAALGRTVASIVDVQGLEIDPEHPGALLFAVGSTAAGLKGTVFTTHGGGAIATLNGSALTGDSFGFTTEQSLDALAVVTSFGTPLAIEVDSPDVSISSVSEATVRVLNGTPGGTVRILASPATLPYAPPVRSGTAGVGLYYVDVTNPLFHRSAVRARWSVPIDASGSGIFTFPTAMAVAGMQRILQPFDEVTGELGDPIVLEAIP
jgi:hypothetical protein